MGSSMVSTEVRLNVVDGRDETVVKLKELTVASGTDEIVSRSRRGSSGSSLSFRGNDANLRGGGGDFGASVMSEVDRQRRIVYGLAGGVTVGISMELAEYVGSGPSAEKVVRS